MRPAERAAMMRQADGGDFLGELAFHLMHGYVFSTDRLFAMGRAVPKGADASDFETEWPAAECNAWFAWVVVGDLRAVVNLLPFELPWVGWHRQGRGWSGDHWMATADFRRRVPSAP